jgi:nucleoside-diphosphate-sugar epimerase
VVVDSVPPDPARPGGHQVALAAAVRAAGGDPRLVVLSTTGVYPRGDGGWIDEDTPVGPDGPRGAARLAAEHAVLSAGIDAVCLRIAAIYGPGRGVAERLRAGTYAVPGDGASWISRIHVDDLVSVILAAGTVRPLPRRIYVVADDAPSTSREHADGVAAMLGLPPPPSVPLASLSPLGRELAGSNRRVRNDRMKRELGVVLRYPSWREGVAADLRSG